MSEFFILAAKVNVDFIFKLDIDNSFIDFVSERVAIPAISNGL